MAFPQVAATSTDTQGTNSTSWTIAYPTSGVAAGHLLILDVAADGNPNANIATEPNWFPLGRIVGPGNAVTLLRFARIAVGDENTRSFTLTLSASEQGAWRIRSINAWGSWVRSGGTSGTATTPSTSMPDPPSLSPYWGAADTLWLAIAAADHGNTIFTGFPANYTDGLSDRSNGANGAALGTARRELNAATEDPGTFTIDASEQWAAQTMAVRPDSGHSNRPRMIGRLSGVNVTNATSDNMAVTANTVVLMHLSAINNAAIPDPTIGDGSGNNDLGNGTWELVASLGNSSDLRRSWLYRVVHSSPVTEGLRISFGATSIQGFQAFVVELPGRNTANNGADAIARTYTRDVTSPLGDIRMKVEPVADSANDIVSFVLWGSTASNAAPTNAGHWRLHQDTSGSNMQSAVAYCRGNAPESEVGWSLPSGTGHNHLIAVEVQSAGAAAVPPVRMSPLFVGLTTGTGAGPYTTTSYTPTADRLVVAVIKANNLRTITDISGNGLTWSHVRTVDYATIASPGRRAFLYVAKGASPTAGSLSITFDANPGSAPQVKVVEFAGIDTAASALGNVIQSADARSDSTTGPLTATLSAFANVNNGTVAFTSSEASMGYPLVSDNLRTDHPGGSSLGGLWLAGWTGTNQTSAGVEATDASANAAVVIAIEVKAQAGATTFQQSVAGAITPAGVVVRRGRKLTAGASTPTGAVSRRTRRTVSGSVSSAGTVARRIQRLLAGGTTPDGAGTFRAFKNLIVGGTLATAGSLIRTTRRTLSGVAGPTGTVAKRTGRTLDGAVAPAGAILKTVQRVLDGALSSAGTLRRLVGLARTGVIAPAGAVTKHASRTIGGTVSPAGTLVKQITRLLGGILSTAGSVSNQLGSGLKTVALAGSLSVAGALVRRTGKRTAGAVSPIGTARKRTARLIGAGTITPAGALLRKPKRLVAGSLVTAGALARRVQIRRAGTIGLTGQVSKTARRRLAGTLVLSGGLAARAIRRITLTGQITGSGAVNFVLNPIIFFWRKASTAFTRTPAPFDKIEGEDVPPW